MSLPVYKVLFLFISSWSNQVWLDKFHIKFQFNSFTAADQISEQIVVWAFCNITIFYLMIARSHQCFLFSVIWLKYPKAHTHTHTHTYIYCPIGIMVRVFTNGLKDWDSIPGWVIPNTQKMVLDSTLLNTQHYKVWIKSKWKQSRERSSTLPYTLV